MADGFPELSSPGQTRVPGHCHGRAAAMKGSSPPMPLAVPLDRGTLSDTAAPTESAQVDLTPRMGLREARWTDGRLVLTGFAHRQDRPSARRGSARIVLGLARANEKRQVRVLTRPTLLPEATEESGQDLLNHDWSGFTAVLDPRRLRRRGRWADGVWRVKATLWTGLQRAGGPLAAHWCGSGEYPPASWLDQDVLAEPFFEGGELQIRITTVRARITSARPVEDDLELHGRSLANLTGATLRLRHRQSSAEIGCTILAGADRTFSARLPLSTLCDRPADPRRPSATGRPNWSSPTAKCCARWWTSSRAGSPASTGCRAGTGCCTSSNWPTATSSSATSRRSR